MKHLFAIALALISLQSQAATNLRQVKALLKQELRTNPKNEINRWLRIIKESETKVNGRWQGISSDFQIVPIGEFNGTSESDESTQYLVVFTESSTYHGGASVTPLYFTISIQREGRKWVFSEISLHAMDAQSGLLARNSGSDNPSPADPDISAELRDQLLLEIMLSVGEQVYIDNYKEGNSYSLSGVVSTIQSEATDTKAVISSACRPKPGKDGISNCSWGIPAQKIEFEIYSKNYVNGEHVGKFNQPINETFKVLR